MTTTHPIRSVTAGTDQEITGTTVGSKEEYRGIYREGFRVGYEEGYRVEGDYRSNRRRDERPVLWPF